MAEKPPNEPQARLFVALDLPGEIREEVAAWQRQALSDPALRPMREEAFHITLCFLGHLPEQAIPRIETLMRSLAPRPVELRFDPAPSAAPRGRPRLYTLSATSEAATGLQAELAETLAAERFYEPEKRGFWPHVTVARVRSERLAPERGERRGKARPKRVGEPPAPLPQELTRPFGAVRMALYRSNLKPQGAEYIALSGVDLPSP